MAQIAVMNTMFDSVDSRWWGLEAEFGKLKTIEESYDKLQEDFRELKFDNEEMRVENSKIRTEVKRIGAELEEFASIGGTIDDLEDRSRFDNVEIRGLPEISGEDLAAIVKISKFIGFPIGGDKSAVKTV